VFRRPLESIDVRFSFPTNEHCMSTDNMFSLLSSPPFHGQAASSWAGNVYVGPATTVTPCG